MKLYERYEDNAARGRYGGIIVGVEKGDTVIYRDHRGKYRVDVVTSLSGHHVTAGKAVGEPTLRDAIRLAEREAHKHGYGASAVYGGPPDHVQLGSIVEGRFQAGGDDTIDDLEPYVSGARVRRGFRRGDAVQVVSGSRQGTAGTVAFVETGDYGDVISVRLTGERRAIGFAPEQLRITEHGASKFDDNTGLGTAAAAAAYEGPIYQQGFDAAVRSGDAERRPKTRARMLGLPPDELRQRARGHAPIDLDRRGYDEWVRGWVDGWTALAAEAGIL